MLSYFSLPEFTIVLQIYSASVGMATLFVKILLNYYIIYYIIYYCNNYYYLGHNYCPILMLIACLVSGIIGLNINFEVIPSGAIV